MSKNVAVQVMISVTGDGLTQTLQLTLANITGSPAERALVPVTNGRTQVFFPGPPTYTTVVLIPPNTSTVAKTWDASGATGGALHPSQPSVISVPSGTTSFYVGANGSEVLEAYMF